MPLERYGLTRREVEVLEALGERLSNAEIAARLYVSVRTVESHVGSLMRKFGVTRRRELSEIWAASRPTGRAVGVAASAGVAVAR